MTSSRPPAAADWLLHRFATAPTYDSLTGDLIEEWARRRSRAWYWRQVFAAILMVCWTEIAAHKLLALRALATGWIVFYLAALFLNHIAFWLTLPLRHDSNFLFWFTLSTPMTLVAPASAAAGWIVGRLHRPYQASMLLLFAASLELFSCRRLPWMYHLFLNALGDPRYRPYLATALLGLVVCPLGVFIGGLWDAPQVTGSALPRGVAT